MTDTASPDDRLQALRARRDALRAAQAERVERARRDALVADFDRWRGRELRESGMAHGVHWPWDAPPCGPAPQYPLAFSGVDWRRVPHAVIATSAYAPFVQGLFAEAFDALGIADARCVHVEVSSASMPRLTLAPLDLVRHINAMAGWHSDPWVFRPGEPWLIELYHDGTLSFAPCAGHGPPQA